MKIEKLGMERMSSRGLRCDDDDDDDDDETIDRSEQERERQDSHPRLAFYV